MLAGRLADKFQAAAADYREFVRIRSHYAKFYGHSRMDRLSEAEIGMWSSRIDKQEHIADRRALFATTPLNQTPHGIVVDLIDMLVEFDPLVHAIAEVGVYWGYVLDDMARRYPNIQFTGIDLARDTPEFNAEFQRHNLRFKAGYALDMLENNKIAADAVFFNATATRFRTKELAQFLRIIAARCRYVVFSEPLVHLPGGLVIDPEHLPLKESTPTTLSAEEWPPQYVHNYKGLAEQAGFNILHYRVYEPTFWRGIHRIDMIAVKE
jgi:hypothetical protein